MDTRLIIFEIRASLSVQATKNRRKTVAVHSILEKAGGYLQLDGGKLNYPLF
ncbi:MAG: hypothetical protein IBX61_03795 [Thermoleophilia bacterium]|nr:hypothetical protein [Thermoleophilia bacterium]